MRFKRVEKIVVHNEKETSNNLLVKIKFLKRYNVYSILSILVIMTPLIIIMIRLAWDVDNETQNGKLTIYNDVV